MAFSDEVYTIRETLDAYRDLIEDLGKHELIAMHFDLDVEYSCAYNALDTIEEGDDLVDKDYIESCLHNSQAHLDDVEGMLKEALSDLRNAYDDLDNAKSEVE